MTVWTSDDGKVTLYRADCLDVVGELAGIDTCITDPPYGICFAGKEWTEEGGLPSFFERKSLMASWDQVGGNHHPINGADRTRTRRRENIAYQRAIHLWFDAIAGALKPGASVLSFGGDRTFHRLVCGVEDAGLEVRDVIIWLYGQGMPKGHDIGKATGDEEWAGWNTTLKPAWEPIVLAMKEIPTNFAKNAKEHGVAGLHVDGARTDYLDDQDRDGAIPQGRPTSRKAAGDWGLGAGYREAPREEFEPSELKGRWPSNVAVDEFAAEMIDAQAGGAKRGYYGDESASRFFYCSKVSTAERTSGGAVKNTHPTVKPLDLMRWLCRLTETPTKGTVLDPFMGSGSTGVAAVLEGRSFIGIEKEEETFWVAVERIKRAGALPRADAPKNPEAGKTEGQIDLF